ncbi:MAG: 2OG-Fe(II) oxygenase [Pseudomonadota bacterium]|nr:2OG-Fe(II) oxygenase [Pseudomonadota bacterium]
MTPVDEAFLRDRVRVAEGFIPKTLCEEVMRAIDLAGLEDAVVGDRDDPCAPGRVAKEVRNSLVHSARPVESQVNGALQRIVDEIVEPYYGTYIDYWEYPGILVYPPGGFYVTHNDGESVVHDPDRYVWEWRRTADRDISVVWYLNEDFDGGELVFPSLQLSIRPITGMVVTFPSTHEFAHTAKPVTRGMRFAVATWMAAVDTPRIQSSPPPRVFNRRWTN